MKYIREIEIANACTYSSSSVFLLFWVFCWAKAVESHMRKGFSLAGQTEKRQRKQRSAAAFLGFSFCHTTDHLYNLGLILTCCLRNLVAHPSWDFHKCVNAFEAVLNLCLASLLTVEGED